MKRFTLFLFVALVGLILLGCEDDAKLRVTNCTSALTWIRLDYGSTRYLSPDVSYSRTWSVLNYNSQEVHLNYDGYHVFSSYRNFAIDGGSSINFIINPDAGAIRIYNNSTSYTIKHVYLSPTNQNSWGDDLISDNGINPTEEAIWAVSPGHWDVKIVDNSGESLQLYNQLITLDQTYNFTFTVISDQSRTDVVKGNSTVPSIPNCRIELKKPSRL